MSIMWIMKKKQVPKVEFVYAIRPLGGLLLAFGKVRAPKELPVLTPMSENDNSERWGKK